MSENPSKIETWDGKNKIRVRLFKRFEVEAFVAQEKERTKRFSPHCLTFAGTLAKFERLLVDRKLVNPQNIVTIQTYERLGENHSGREILDKLLETRQTYLPGMHVWPFNFNSFSQCYTSKKCLLPSDSKTAGWRHPPYYEVLARLTRAKPKRFSVLDLDFCGIFNESNSQSVVNVFNNGVMHDRGVAFITHQKGRDVRGGKLFDVLHGYLKPCKLINFNTIPFSGDPDKDTYAARYILIPLYYMCKAYEAGHVMSLERLVEYRDKNSSSGLAVNMLQYFFRWRPVDSFKEPFITMRTNLEEVMNEQYNYNIWID